MKILAAMSGGVDSSVAAALLAGEGHEVTGAYMKNWINEEGVIGSCPWENDIADARAVAARIGIEFVVVNLMREYRERVVGYLLEGYRSGTTPNPDAMCNREIKFGALWGWARARGFDAIATGHYARKSSAGTILRGSDPNKDQSYFLAMMRPEQVRIARFPVGHLLKPELREIARSLGLETAEKKDSQGICFIGQVKMTDFLRAFLPDSPGPIVDVEGRVLGRHRGLHLHTLGQRRGVGVASPVFRHAYVVIAKRPETNELVVAIEREDTPFLRSRHCTLASLSWTGDPVTAPRALLAQPRYRCPAGAADFVPMDDDRASLVFRDPQRALTPGQICALYDGDTLLGGGIFESVGGG
jgi:tRNA-specific 2-thiouridylase